MGIKAFKQIEAGTVTRSLLAAAVITELDQIATNTTAIAAINDSLGQPNGIATLNAQGALTASQIHSLALHGYAGEVNSEAEMLALTTNIDGTPIEKGDRVDRLDLGRTLIFSGGDLTDAANWKKILAENTVVTSLRNTSGTVMGEVGVVTLADVAFSGAAADVSGLADVATSGAAADVSLADAGELYDATTVEAALAEVMGDLNQEVADRQNAINNVKTDAVTAATLVEGTVTGTQDDSNNAFTISGVDTSKHVFFFRDGIEQLAAGFASRSGSSVTTTISAPASDEALKVFGYPNP